MGHLYQVHNYLHNYMQSYLNSNEQWNLIPVSCGQAHRQRCCLPLSLLACFSLSGHLLCGKLCQVLQGCPSLKSILAPSRLSLSWEYWEYWELSCVCCAANTQQKSSGDFYLHWQEHPGNEGLGVVDALGCPAWFSAFLFCFDLIPSPVSLHQSIKSSFGVNFA